MFRVYDTFDSNLTWCQMMTGSGGALSKTAWFWDVGHCDIANIGNWYGVTAGFFTWDDMVLTLIMQFISSILTSDLSQDFWSHMSSHQNS